MDKKWHHNHLCCHHCDKPLSTQSFVTVEGKPWCNKCHDEDLANRSEKCEEVIDTDTSICKGDPGSRHQSTVDLTHPSNLRKPRTKRHERVTESQTTPPGVTSPSLCKQCVGYLTSHEVIYEQVLWEGAYGFSVLIRKESNHLKILTRRQCFLLSYLRTLSDGPAEVWTYDLLHNSCMLHQLMSYWSCVTVIRTMGLC